MSTLPIVDLSQIDKDPQKESQLVSEWNDAFRTYGFVYISSSSHGLGPLYERVETESLRFFTQLSPEEKQAYSFQKGYGHGAYTPQGIERVAASSDKDSVDNDPADWVESFCVHNSQADHVPTDSSSAGGDFLVPPYKYGREWKRAIQELWKGLDRLLMKVMKVSAKALELPDSYFDSCYEHPSNFMRLAHYVPPPPPPPSKEERSSPIIRYGAHTDYQGFTFLWRNASNGLQCAKPTTTTNIQEWIPVPVLKDDPHAIVVNAGDLIQRWTNDYWISNIHRVVAPPNNEQEDGGEPLSIVFFTGPSPETRIQSLPSPRLSSRRDVYEVVTAGEHLQRKLERTSL